MLVHDPDHPLVNFYPRSPCGERLLRPRPISVITRFLSTLSLRRATGRHCSNDGSPVDFYPRSPCGERPPLADGAQPDATISIHALLAESDARAVGAYVLYICISIHALLAESDAYRPGLWYDT